MFFNINTFIFSADILLIVIKVSKKNMVFFITDEK